MKILKILGIAAGIHALALLLIFANPGCSYTKAAATEPSPISAAPGGDAGPAPSSAVITPPDTVGIRYSPTRPGTTVAGALESQPVADVTPATTYTVARGDSLWSIAKKNQITKADLAAANNLKTSAVLHLGQKLIIPSKAGHAAPEAEAAPARSTQPAPAEKTVAEGTKHTVRPGETLGAIARKYGVKQGDIAVANNITDPRKIQPGQELVIPARSSSSGSKQAKAAKASDQGKAPAGSTAERGSSVPADQDLDAGLKPPSASDVPVVKIEDPSAAPQPKNP